MKTTTERRGTHPLTWAGLGAAASVAVLTGLGIAPATGKLEPAPVIIGNEGLGWDEIRPRLAEVAGAQIVEELTIERALRAELALNHMTLKPEDVQRERELFAQTLRLAVPAGSDPSVDAALTRVRRSRALGPERYRALLERNAMLRKLVGPEVRVSESDVRASLEVRFGPRVRCSIIVLGAESDARRLHGRLSAVPPAELAGQFAAEARLLSIDPSGARGGEIDPVSPADPSYAASFRDALRDLQPGQLSEVLVFDRGYAVALGVERLAAVTPPEGAEQTAREDVRQRVERAAMDRLAGRLLNSAAITVLDPGLNWSWSGRPGR